MSTLSHWTSADVLKQDKSLSLAVVEGRHDVTTSECESTVNGRSLRHSDVIILDFELILQFIGRLISKNIAASVFDCVIVV